MSGIEILGIAASVLQIAELGGKLSVKLFTFTRKIKNADKQIDSISQDIAATGAVLQQLGNELKKDEHLRLCSPEAITEARNLMQACRAVFDDLNDTIDGKGKAKGAGRWLSLKRGLNYAFVEDQILLLKAKLEHLKSSLLVMLNVLIFAGQLRGQEALSVLDDQRELLKELLEEKVQNQRHFDLLLKRLDHLTVNTAGDSASTTDGKEVPVPSSSSITLVSTNTSIGSAPSRTKKDIVTPHLPMHLHNRAEEIFDHCRLVNALIGEVNHVQYKIDLGIKYRVQQKILESHFHEWEKDWECHKADEPVEARYEYFGQLPVVKRYWIEQACLKQPSSQAAGQLRGEHPPMMNSMFQRQVFNPTRDFRPLHTDASLTLADFPSSLPLSQQNTSNLPDFSLSGTAGHSEDPAGAAADPVDAVSGNRWPSSRASTSVTINPQLLQKTSVSQGNAADFDIVGGPNAAVRSKHDKSSERQQRKYQACEACRRRKVRCSLGKSDGASRGPCARCRREKKACKIVDRRLNRSREISDDSCRHRDVKRDETSTATSSTEQGTPDRWATNLAAEPSDLSQNDFIQESMPALSTAHVDADMDGNQIFGSTVGESPEGDWFAMPVSRSSTRAFSPPQVQMPSTNPQAQNPQAQMASTNPQAQNMGMYLPAMRVGTDLQARMASTNVQAMRVGTDLQAEMARTNSQVQMVWRNLQAQMRRRNLPAQMGRRSFQAQMVRRNLQAQMVMRNLQVQMEMRNLQARPIRAEMSPYQDANAHFSDLAAPYDKLGLKTPVQLAKMATSLADGPTHILDEIDMLIVQNTALSSKEIEEAMDKAYLDVLDIKFGEAEDVDTYKHTDNSGSPARELEDMAQANYPPGISDGPISDGPAGILP